MATRLSDGDDRFANEAGPEQRRLPEVPRRAHLVQGPADEVPGGHPHDLLDLEGREPERLRNFDRRRRAGGGGRAPPRMPIGISPAPIPSAAIFVTPSTISVEAPKVGVSPRSATGMSRRSRWWSIM